MTSEDIKDLADKKQRQEVLELFVKEIATNKVYRKQAFQLMQATPQDKTASVKGAFHLACIMYDINEDVLAFSKTLFEIVFAIFDDYSERITRIENEMQTIAENTGVDLSKMKTDVDQLKETIGPKVSAVIQLFANLQKEEERRKNNGSDMLV